ncbi:MAG: phospho-N-acetylmuramoyl-pentapeptide-transferase [Erysipelotrichaceae bacterium]|nr:phospho-N-acetylmuramoyl-pentapeptide-transferase [Erysipelotrichaceae bacterium]
MDPRTLEFLRLVLGLLLSFFLSSFLVKRKIKSSRVGQQERNYLDNHIIKNGTPTMGGVPIVISTIIIFLALTFKDSLPKEIITLLVIYLGFFLVGFVDDYSKLKLKSYRGISGKLRLLLETFFVIWGLVVISKNIDINNLLSFSLNGKELTLGILTIPAIVFIIVGSANAFNLTDGLDGLASGLCIIALIPLIMISLISNQFYLALFLITQVGSLLGFLCFNIHPAKIFMGDVGSLPLGALLGTTAIILNKPLILLIAGLIFVLETISVIIQVVSFQTTGKRVFLMTPIHHHFEKMGWPEWKVVMVFWLVGIILAIVAVAAGVLG